MRILFLALYTPVYASSRTRVYQYLPYLQKKGIVTKTIPCLNKPLQKTKPLERVVPILKMLEFLCLAPFYDIVFIQKVLAPKWFAKLVKLFNQNIVYDFDDAIYLRENGQEDIIKKEQLASFLSISRGVVSENDWMKKFASNYNKNILVIPGPIETDLYRPSQRSQKKVVIGWIGSPSTTQYLNLVKNVFQKLTEKYPNLEIHLIGAENFKVEGARIIKKEWSLETEANNLKEFDIGIMPLYDNEWTRGKGGYKLLLYGALGIPSVASPVGINSEIIQNGKNGYLAFNEKEWLKYLTILIESPELRQEMGKKARKQVEQKYSYKVSTPKLINFLEKITTNNQSANFTKSTK